jgi:hypothetical protein
MSNMTDTVQEDDFEPRRVSVAPVEPYFGDNRSII